MSISSHVHNVESIRAEKIKEGWYMGLRYYYRTVVLQAGEVIYTVTVFGDTRESISLVDEEKPGEEIYP